MRASEEKKLLAMDLDGTAVGDDYQMGSLTRAAILEIRKRGYVTAFVTGRRDVDMRSMSKENICADYLILNNGGKIIRCKDKEVLYNRKVSRKDCNALIKHCLENHMELHICDGEEWMVNVMTQDTLDYAKELDIFPKSYFTVNEIDCKDGIEGFMSVRDWESVGEYIDRNFKEVVYTLSEPGCIDIMAAGISKWDGIRKLSKLEEIAPEDIIAVGNFYNDIDMIRHAAVGIAVANSPEDVKAIADYVTVRTNNEDAVAEVIEKFCGGAVFSQL